MKIRLIWLLSIYLSIYLLTLKRILFIYFFASLPLYAILCILMDFILLLFYVIFFRPFRVRKQNLKMYTKWWSCQNNPIGNEKRKQRKASEKVETSMKYRAKWAIYSSLPLYAILCICILMDFILLLFYVVFFQPYRVCKQFSKCTQNGDPAKITQLEMRSENERIGRN